MMQCNPTLSENQLTSTSEKQQVTMDSPMQIRLINFLGLKNYLMQKFIFRRKQSSYHIRKQNNKNKIFIPHQYKPPMRYTLQVGIIQHGKHSIPYVKLIPRNSKFTSNKFSKLNGLSNNTNTNNDSQKEYHDTIVYAHGNSSDLSDGLRFMERMALIYQAEYVIFDYSGYGQSRCTEVGQQIIAKDIEIVLAWLNKPLNQIILWGFSLGSYPVLYAASKYHVKGIILQCPIASVACFFQEKLSSQVKFKQDYFPNINLIQSVKSKIFIVHSHADQIIPISHVQLLFDKYTTVNGTSKIFFIEVMKLSHNGLHKYISAQKSNDLQRQLLSFLEQLKINETEGYKEVDQRLIYLKSKIKLSKIHENQFQQDKYQLVDGPNNIGVKTKKIKTNCLCFPEEPSYKSNREKFRSN